MFKVSDIISTPPSEFLSPLQKEVYSAFERLGMDYGRVDTDPGLTMEDCQNIDRKIGCRIVKTIFLCNRQQTEFYLYVTTDDKPFVTKDFCRALGIPRVSFAPSDKLLELTGVNVGATTVLSMLLPSASGVHLVMDKGVTLEEWFACTDGTPTCFVKMKTVDLMEKFLPSTGHVPVLIGE